MTSVPTYEQSPPLVLHTRPAIDLSPEQFYEFCLLNREWRIERTAEGDLRIMAPVGGRNEQSECDHHINAHNLGVAGRNGRRL